MRRWVSGTMKISEQECFELLHASSVGRVGFRHPDGLQILPVNYVVDGNTIVFQTSATGPIAMLADGSDDVVFQVDYHDSVGGSGWSVMMNGHIQPTTPGESDSIELPQRLVSWAGGERSLRLRFLPTSISGRRVRRHTN